MAATLESKSIDYLQLHANELLAQIKSTHQPIAITENGQPQAILQDLKSYETLHNTIFILKKLLQGEQDIQAGRLISQEELEANMANILSVPTTESNELFGIWADRNDLDNVEDYLRTLRKSRFL